MLSTAMLLLSSASAFHPGLAPLSVRPAPRCAAPVAAVPWRIAGAASLASAGVAATTVAVRQAIRRKEEKEAAKGRLALAGLNSQLSSADVLDKKYSLAENTVVKGDWKEITKPDGRKYYTHMPSGKQQWTVPEEWTALETAAAQ